MHPKLKTIFLSVVFILSTLTALADEERREFRVINASDDLADNSAQIVTCTKTGRMIIATIGNLNFYDGTTFSHIDTHQEYQFQLPLYRGGYRLYFDHYHHSWLKNTNMVSCIDMTMERFVPDAESVLKGLGCEDPVQDLFADSDGQLWLLTEKGLYGVDRKNTYQVLRDRNLQDMEVFDSLLLTFYDNGEEVGQDLNTGRTVHRTKAYEWEDAQKYTNSSLIMRYENGFFQIRNGAKEAILMFFDARKLAWETLMQVPYHLNNMAINGNKLYMASERGYWIYNIHTKEQTHVESFKLKGKDAYLQTDCNTMAFDKQGGMWIGTEKRGVLYARPIASPFRSLTWDNPQASHYASMMDNLSQNISEFNGKQANCMFMDSRNWSWFGTTTGLYMYRSPKSDPVVFDKKNGLLNNVIHSIIEDKDHNIWVSTSCGISCILFEGDKPVFVNSFNEADNVPNESFINCKAMCLPDSTIVMQSLDHIVVFNPREFRLMNDRLPLKFYPKLIRLMVNGNYVEPGESIDGNVVIDRAITRVKDISVAANQNTIMLTFSGLNYFRPLQTFYRVRLKGLDDDWHVYSFLNGSEHVDAEGRLHLSLIGLKPGDYDVEVQASMFPDQWPGEPYIWTVHVNQPWWQATGAYIILMLLVLGLMIVNFFYYNKNTRLRAQRNTEEGDIIRKIRSFVNRCDALSGEMMRPSFDDIKNFKNKATGLSPDFIELMLKLIPYVREHQLGELTLHNLSEVGGMDVAKLYEITVPNLYKSPSDLVRLIRLQKAEELLRTTDKSIEDIAKECGFYTPNFLIGSFFHQYKLTPKEYREENAE